MENLNDDLIERYVIYLANKEVGISITGNQLSDEEREMMDRLVSINTELKERIKFLKKCCIDVYGRLDKHPIGHLWIHSSGLLNTKLGKKPGHLNYTASFASGYVILKKTTLRDWFLRSKTRKKTYHSERVCLYRPL